jgi:hypothetical protein
MIVRSARWPSRRYTDAEAGEGGESEEAEDDEGGVEEDCGSGSGDVGE